MMDDKWIAEVRNMDLLAYIEGLGFKCKRRSGINHWFCSPLRDEHTASFKVDTKKNKWTDYGLPGEGRNKFLGGDLIDFGMRYFNCTFVEFMDRMTVGNFSFHRVPSTEQLKESEEAKIKVLGIKSLFSGALLHYLKSVRRIPIQVADQFCKEVTYEVKGNEYFGIGFQNDKGGYEIRSSFAKVSSMPKDITTIRNGGSEVMVFEGFMDFLTFVTLHGMEVVKKYDFAILNGAVFFNSAKEFLESHKTVHLYAHNDATGQKHKDYALSKPDQYVVESDLFKGYADLNEWHVAFGHAMNPKPALRL